MRPYLSSPGKIGALTVKNRVIMEAMGNALSNLDGSMSAEDIAFYEARAKGGRRTHHERSRLGILQLRPCQPQKPVH